MVQRIPQAQANTSEYLDRYLPDIKNLIVAAWGEVKSCKTTLGLTFPKPIVHFDFDQGFIRAANRIPGNIRWKLLDEREALTPELLDQGLDIIVKPFQVPVVFPGPQNFSPTYDLYMNQVVPQIMLAIYDPKVATIIYDTGTLLWKMVNQAELEGKQMVAAQNGRTRERLSPIEYAAPNQSMRFFIGQAKAMGKNVYICHHSRGVFEDIVDQTGREVLGKKPIGQTWDGWSKLGAIVDTVMITGIRAETKTQGVGQQPTVERLPVATFQHCGYTLEAEGKEVVEPTFDKILDFINHYRSQG